MKIRYKAFILPHLGDPYRQCADRFSISEKEMAFAISDGVGNSLFPEVWAKALCDDYVQAPENFICNNSLCRENELIYHWGKIRDERVASFTPDELFIYEVGLDKADFAAATFVGLQISADNWSCWSLGDSYLGILDQDYNIVKQIASMAGKPFDNYPEYFASKKESNNGEPVFDSGSIKDVRFFILMSDALSDWFFSKDRSKDQRKALLDIETHEEYCSFIGDLRAKGELKDDDTTIVVLNLEHDDCPGISFEKLEIDNIEKFIKNDVETSGNDPSGTTNDGNNCSDKGLQQAPTKDDDKLAKLKEEIKIIQKQLDNAKAEIKRLNEEIKKLTQQNEIAKRLFEKSLRNKGLHKWLLCPFSRLRSIKR